MQTNKSTAGNGKNRSAVASRKTSRIHLTEAVVAELPVKDNAAPLAVIHSKLSLPAFLEDNCYRGRPDDIELIDIARFHCGVFSDRIWSRR